MYVCVLAHERTSTRTHVDLRKDTHKQRTNMDARTIKLFTCRSAGRRLSRVPKEGGLFGIQL